MSRRGAALLALVLTLGGCAAGPTRLWLDRQPVPVARGSRVYVLASSDALGAAAAAAVRSAGLRLSPGSRTDAALAEELGRGFRHAALVHDGGTLDKMDEDFAATRQRLEALVNQLKEKEGAPPSLLVAWGEPGGGALAGLFQLERWRLLALTARPDADAVQLLRPLLVASRRGALPVRKLRPPLEADRFALPVPLLPNR